MVHRFHRHFQQAFLLQFQHSAAESATKFPIGNMSYRFLLTMDWNLFLWWPPHCSNYISRIGSFLFFSFLFFFFFFFDEPCYQRNSFSLTKLCHLQQWSDWFFSSFCLTTAPLPLEAQRQYPSHRKQSHRWGGPRIESRHRFAAKSQEFDVVQKDLFEIEQ